MTTRKPRSYKSIVDFIERTNDALYDALNTVCLQYKFAANDRPGVTFLMPTDEDYIEEIVKLTQNDRPEDEKQANVIFSSLIIYDALKSPGDFRKKDEIVNDLRQLVEVDQRACTLDTVVFKNGAKATVNTFFRDNCRKDNICVYDLTGRIPLDAPSAKTKPARVKRSKEKPQSEQVPKQIDEMRYALGVETETAYMYRRLNESSSADEYRDAVLSFLCFLFRHRDRKAADAILYERVLPLVSRQWAADFYLVFEPRSLLAEYIVPSGLLEEWITSRRKKSRVDYRYAYETLNRYLDNYPQSANASVYTQRIAMLNSIDDVRLRIENMPLREMVEACIEEYRGIVDKNAVGDTQNAYPGWLSDMYRRDRDQKLLEDEFRQYLLLEFSRLERMANKNDLVIAFGELVEKINDYITNYHGNSYIPAVCRLKLFNLETARCANSDVRRHLAHEFVMSSNFAHVALSASDLKSSDFPHEDYTVNRPPTDKPEYWNIAVYAMKRFERTVSTTGGGNDDDACARKIEKLISKHGDRLDDGLKQSLNASLRNHEDKKTRAPTRN